MSYGQKIVYVAQNQCYIKKTNKPESIVYIEIISWQIFLALSIIQGFIWICHMDMEEDSGTAPGEEEEKNVVA